MSAMALEGSSWAGVRRKLEAPARICLGPGAPQGMSEFISHAGIEVLPFAQKHLAGIYVDFVGARPGGVEVLSVDLGTKRSAHPASDLVTDSWHAAASLVISHALKLKPPLVTADPEMLLTVKTALGVADSHVPVLLSGEIGSGKYNLARFIHSGSRTRAPLATVGCAGLENVELERFRRSLLDPDAPPGVQRSLGALIYFDEIAELSDAAQLKLFNLLQLTELTPECVAGVREQDVAGFRFISATNRPLAAMVERGGFRKDLYWRLNVFSIRVPALRERPCDIALLARYFLRRANPRRSFTPMALKILGGYSFPGNVVELESLVTRLAISPLAAGATFVDVADIRRHLMIAHGTEPAPTSNWKNGREEARREMLLSTIAAAGGNRAEAARRLGITPRALQYHITKAGLSRRRRSYPAPVTVAAVEFAASGTAADSPPIWDFCEAAEVQK